MVSYYNEIDPYAAQWLRNLIANKLIADGDVDERSIRDVAAADLRSYTQCHFFAGIGVWSYALRLAGWPDDRPVWTGSCPCQPFSAAGKGKGFDDDRHLWPAWFRLIDACRPPVIFGEQVASADVVGKASKSRGRQAVRDSLSDAAQGARPGAPRRASGEPERDFLRSVGSPSGAAGEDRRGQVRGDWSAAEFERRQDMGQSVSRSHRPSERLRLLECAGGLSWCEQRDGGLGRAETGRDGESYLGHAEAEIERLLAGFGREAEGENTGPWLDAVFNDLERIGYAAGAHVLPACGIGAPHIRQRLWFVGERLDDTAGARHVGALAGAEGEARDEARLRLSGEGRGSGGLADAERVNGRRQYGRRLDRAAEASAGETGQRERIWPNPTDDRADGGLADACNDGPQGRVHGGAHEGRQTLDGSTGRDGADRGREHARSVGRERGQAPAPGHDDDGSAPGGAEGQHGAGLAGPHRLHQDGARPTDGHWRNADWLFCRDGKWRPVEPGTFPLAHGAPARVGRLRAYGNAIVPQVAAEVIGAYLDARP